MFSTRDSFWWVGGKRFLRRPLIVLCVVALAVLMGLLARPPAAQTAFPGDNGKIVFQSDRDGNYEIYVMAPDGSGQTRLTSNPASDFGPAWSPDGSKVAFYSNRSGNSSIHVMNADGSGVTQLTAGNPNGDFEPGWSPDGTKIVFTRSVGPGKSEIYVMNADGSGLTGLTANGMLYGGPVWSPKGDKIAFTRSVGLGWDSEIYVMNPDGSAQTNLTNYPSLLDGYPDWSPDGARISFSRYGYGNASDIFAMNADGTGQTNLTNSPGADDAGSAWSPDGSKIAFHSDKFAPANGDIYVMNADGSAVTRLTSATASDSGPDWQAIDATPPVLQNVPGDMSVHAEDASGAHVTYTEPTAIDDLDPAPTVSCDRPSGSLFPLGDTTVTCTARDASGNESTATFTVTVSYDYSGFFAPVDMNNVVNVVKGGSTVPLKFSIHAAGGGYISDLAAVTGFEVYRVSCDLTSTIDTIEFTTTGGTSLRYDYGANQFVQNWKTPKEIGCKKVVLTLADGSKVTAYFRLK